MYTILNTRRIVARHKRPPELISVFRSDPTLARRFDDLKTLGDYLDRRVVWAEEETAHRKALIDVQTQQLEEQFNTTLAGIRDGYTILGLEPKGSTLEAARDLWPQAAEAIIRHEAISQILDQSGQFKDHHGDIMVSAPAPADVVVEAGRPVRELLAKASSLQARIETEREWAAAITPEVVDQQELQLSEEFAARGMVRVPNVDCAPVLDEGVAFRLQPQLRAVTGDETTVSKGGP